MTVATAFHAAAAGENVQLDTAGDYLGYIAGNCTAFVARATGWIPAGLGNATDWLKNASAMGYQTGDIPTVGSVAVYHSGSGYSEFGHVALVTGVNNDGTFQVQEENYNGLGVVDTRTSTLSDVEGFIYAPGAAGHSTASAATSSGGSSQTLGSLHSFLNPPSSNAPIVGGLVTSVDTWAARGPFIIAGLMVFGIGLWLLLGRPTPKVVPVPV